MEANVRFYSPSRSELRMVCILIKQSKSYEPIRGAATHSTP